MDENFRKPDFSKKDLEVRFEDNVVCIYGTAEGLRKLAELCNNLVDEPNQGHIHLENLRLLTGNSEKCSIAIFEKD